MIFKNDVSNLRNDIIVNSSKVHSLKTVNTPALNKGLFFLSKMENMFKTRM